MVGVPAAFADLLQKNYGAGLKEVDFRQTSQACAAINDWIARQTNDRVKDIIPQDGVNAKTRPALANAVYFKSKGSSTTWPRMNARCSNCLTSGASGEP